MKDTMDPCRLIEPELIALAGGEASPAGAARVEAHIAGCGGCRDALGRYRELEGELDALRAAPVGADPTLARAELAQRLADLRSRLVGYGVFPSPLGPILIARSELGVSMVEYLEPGADPRRAGLGKLAGTDAVEAREVTEPLYRDVLDYLAGRRTDLEWPLDLRWTRSDFQRQVLEATARLPYGAVTSYAGIAREIGQPQATRAVAQALRHNPVPIVVPCHRVIGSSGALTGYAGKRVDLKRQLLAVEGVRADQRIDRAAMYVQYMRENAYCVPTCGALPTEPLSNLTLFGRRERAEAAGLVPCSDCRPDLHPLPPI